MNTFNDLLVHPVFQRLGWMLVHSVWQGAGIALLAAIVLAILGRRSSQSRYVVSCAALMLMLVLPVATFFVLPGPIVRPDVPLNIAQPIARGPLVSMLPPPLSQATPAEPPTLMQRMQPLLPACAALWIIGIAILSIRHVGGWVRVQQLRSRAKPLSGEPWDGLMVRICERLRVKRVVQIAESALVQVPSVVGYLKPIILLPLCAMSGLSSQQLEGLIAHELAHVRRHDYLVNLVQIIVETLLFYHPAAWWISRRIRQERENCCDDLAAEVCGNQVAYVQALAAMEELRMVPGELVLAARGGSLLPRVRRLLGVQSPRQRSWSLTAAIVVVIVALVPLLVAQRKANADEAKPTTKPASTETSSARTSPIQEADLKAAEGEYTIAANDLVQVSIMDLTGTGVETVKSVRVNEKGAISLPYVGSVIARGLTEDELQKAIAKAYGDAHIIKNPNIGVTIAEARGRLFSIFGNVSRPGQYVIVKNDFRLLDALATSGGLTDGPDIARVMRKGDDGKERVIEAPLKGLIEGELKYNLVIRPNDMVVIAARGKIPANPAPQTSVPSPTPAPTPTPKISAEMQRALDRALPETNFSNTPFGDVIEFLRDVTSTNIFADWKTIEALGIDKDAPVTFKAKNISLKKVLDLTLAAVSAGDSPLGYTIDENVIRIGLPKANNALSSATFATSDPFVNAVTEIQLRLAQLKSQGYGDQHQAVRQAVKELELLSKQRADAASAARAKAPTPAPEPAPVIDPQMKAQLERKLPEVNFAEVPFSDVIDFLRDVTAANIFVNWRALESAGIDKNAPVTVRLRDIGFSKALQIVLESVGGSDAKLAYTADQGVISISVAKPDLMQTIDGIRAQFAQPATQPAGVSGDPKAAEADIRMQLQQIDTRLDQTKSVYASSHPDVLKLQAQRDALAKRLIVLSDGNLTFATTQLATQPLYQAVRIVVGPEKITLEGKETTWEKAKDELAKLPNRGDMVLEVAAASDEMTLAQHHQVVGKGLILSSELKFRYLSDVGVQQLGSKANDETKPPSTQAAAEQVPQQAQGPGQYFVAGKVPRTGAYSLVSPEGVRFSQALAAAGGAEQGAKRLRIVRKVPGKPEEQMEISLDDLRQPDKNGFVFVNDQILVGNEASAATQASKH